MLSKQTSADYESKETPYYQQTRPEMMAFVPANATAILDVGCSEGQFGHALKQRQHCSVWGVEIMPQAAAAARGNLDQVFSEPFDENLPLPANHFDCVIFNDCLEHLEAPENALTLAASLLKSGGVIVASIPNIRYYPVIRDLVVFGKWEYADFGVLDRTHRFFFTCSTIRNMFERLNFEIVTLRGVNAKLWGAGRVFTLLNTLLLGRISDMQYQQFVVVAQPKRKG